jgi:hypothetical protein
VTSRTIPNAAVVVAAADVLASDFGAELVMLDLRDGVYYGLEDVGARVWSLVQQPIKVSAILDALVAEYDVEPARCERDLRSLLTELAARRLIEVRVADA